MNMVKRHYLALGFFWFTTICPFANAQALPEQLPEHHPNGHTPMSDPAHLATSYQLKRQKLMERIEVLAKEGAGIAAYKTTLDAIDKKSVAGVDQEQLTVELEKLAQEVTEQEQTRSHIKELEAHPPTQWPVESRSGLPSARSPSEPEAATRAQEKLKEGDQIAQGIRERAAEQIKDIQEEERKAIYRMCRLGKGFIILSPEEDKEAREPYEHRIREIRELSENQANDVLQDYQRQAAAINPPPR